MQSRYHTLLLYCGGLSHMLFVILKSVSFNILEIGTRAPTFNFRSVFIIFNEVWITYFVLDLMFTQR
jgi:hypothetical protein